MLARPLTRLLGAGVAVVLVALVWFLLQVFPLGGSGRLVIVTVHRGDSVATIANEMHVLGVIHSPLAFRLDIAMLGAPIVQPGSYRIAQNSSFASVRSIFGAPPNVQVVDVTPGLTLNEVALAIASDKGNSFADSFVQDAGRAADVSAYHPRGSLEGLIGVGSYILTPQETPSSLLARMTATFAREASSVGLTPQSNVNGLNAYQLVTAASIVEREGYYQVNMARVARVIFNRLQRGQHLQMDATVTYYFHQDGGPVTAAMLRANTPYNTYLYPGLTPTPICSVSSAALHAVLHAPPGPWLYFVLVNKDGTMAFSTTFDQQLANERLAASRGLG